MHWWLIDSEREVAGMLADLKLAFPAMQVTEDLGLEFQGVHTSFGNEGVDIQFNRGVCLYPMRVYQREKPSSYSFVLSPGEVTQYVQRAYA